MNCETCKFWDQSCSPQSKRKAERRLHDAESGLCRRYPAALDATYAPNMEDKDLVTESPTAFVQPLTWGDDWCGEWVACS